MSSSYGLNTNIDLEGSLSGLPGNVFIKIRDQLDTNPADKDWRALIRAVDEEYHIRPGLIERWSPAISDGSPSTKLLNDLSSQGMLVKQLRDYLEKINIDTYFFGLTPYEDIVIIESPPSLLDVQESGVLSLTVEATGHPYPRYQWFCCVDGENDFKRMQGYTEKTLTINGVSAAHAGGYSCQIHNCGEREKVKLTEITLVTITPCPSIIPSQPQLQLDENVYFFHSINPDSWQRNELDSLRNGFHGIHIDTKYPSIEFNLIIGHPRDLLVTLKESFVLSVETRGDPPIAYQWYRDDKKLLDQRQPKLCVTSACPQDFGRYYCEVNNGVKMEKSLTASVIERCPFPAKNTEISIISHPKSLVATFGGSAIFSCEAHCNEPLNYQWFKDGSPLEGETEPEIKIINIQERMKEGLYMCKVYVAPPPTYANKLGDLSVGTDTYQEKLTAGAMLTLKIPDVNDNHLQYNPHDKVALLIGNSDYKSETQLKAPSQDVQALRESLHSLKFKVISLLNLTKPEIENAILEFCKLVDRNVYAVFYFCGHGFEENGMSYLVPTDAPSAYKAEECVCAHMVLENIQKKQPPLILMIMDICRQRGKVPSNGMPGCLDMRTKKGNTVFCYATSLGMAAYENNTHGYGLLVKHLAPLIRKKIGADHLISKLKEEFNRFPKHSNIQLPELRSNLLEPRRSLADQISYKGETQAFHMRTQIWMEAHQKPPTQKIMFNEIGAAVELEFQSYFSNILHIFVTVVQPGQNVVECEGKITNLSPRISQLGETLRFNQGDKMVTKTTLQDIQKLEGNLVVDVTITFKMPAQAMGTFFLMRRIDLGLPLVAKLKLWQPSVNFEQQRREPIEQMEETDTSSSL